MMNFPLVIYKAYTIVSLDSDCRVVGVPTDWACSGDFREEMHMRSSPNWNVVQFSCVGKMKRNFGTGSKLEISPYLVNHIYDLNNPKIHAATPSQ